MFVCLSVCDEALTKTIKPINVNIYDSVGKSFTGCSRPTLTLTQIQDG